VTATGSALMRLHFNASGRLTEALKRAFDTRMAKVVANRDVPRNVDDLGSRLEKSPRKIVRSRAQALLQRERLLRCDGQSG